MFIGRAITPMLRDLGPGPLGRRLILTGARQTGKTTLLQHEFGEDYEYHTFDEPFARAALTKRSAADWLARGPHHVLDEVQKAPDFMGTIKAILDRGGPEIRLILSETPKSSCCPESERPSPAGR